MDIASVPSEPSHSLEHLPGLSELLIPRAAEADGHRGMHRWRSEEALHLGLEKPTTCGTLACDDLPEDHAEGVDVTLRGDRSSSSLSRVACRHRSQTERCRGNCLVMFSQELSP